MKPPMRFNPHLLDEIRSRLPVSAVVARKVRLKKQGREFAGLSPFKDEKTPSFFVNDQKGFYHCFASGEHGDIFTFLMKTEGLSFPEAVQRLAHEAGVSLPSRPEADSRQTEVRLRLYDVLEAATAVFEANLQRAGGREARDYLARRQVTDETLAQFRLGYATGGRQDLAGALRQKGFRDDEMVAAGLLISGDDIPKPYDRFRKRVIFPITDAKNRVIAFGGRALEPGQPAKYLNSPETALFHKGQLLFNASRAREAAFKAGEVIVVEGYMDVIALHQAGFTAAVAPLGTALTTEQLALLWRMAPEPVLCFDGDSAGQKAAFRAVDTALPALKPGFSLRFAFLPDGLDPDDIIRERGPGAVRKAVDQAQPLEDVLWLREWSKGVWTTAEQRALLEKNLREAVTQISDTSVRFHYSQAIKSKLFAAWRSAGRSRVQSNGAAHKPAGASTGTRHMRPGSHSGRFAGVGLAAAAASRSLRGSALASAGETSIAREALILQLVLDHPWLLDEAAEELGELPLTLPQTKMLRDRILDIHARGSVLDTNGLRSQLHQSGLEDCLKFIDRSSSLNFNRFSNAEDARAAVIQTWRHVMGRHSAGRQLEVELREVLSEFEQSGREDDYERMVAIWQLLTSIDHAEASS